MENLGRIIVTSRVGSMGKTRSSPPPDIVINTSTEHMPHSTWWENIPPGQWVVLQNTDMRIDDHVNRVESVQEFIEKFPMSEVLYSGELYFDYRNESSFKRFMLIKEDNSLQPNK
ncbi:MAG: hypothetical protein R2827_08115 [Bdellovibrionales bacterium]